LPGLAKHTRSTGLGCTTGHGLAKASASICSGITGCDVITPVSLSGLSVQHGQSFVAGSVAAEGRVDLGFISKSVEGHCAVRHGKILWNSVRKGRCQHLEVRTTTDRIMLKMISAYTHVV
jgi:hypothetical protein